MRGVVNTKKYLGVSLKSGEYKQYLWDNVTFDAPTGNLVVRDLNGELVLFVPLNNIEYYERIEE
jgi:hypothetical protein